jgi:regulator of nucleoside diphosphate kinase
MERTEKFSGDQAETLRLQAVLDSAEIVQPDEVPGTLITLNSVATIINLESGRAQEFALVLPAQADMQLGRVSVLAPLGTAMLGRRKGDIFTAHVPAGARTFRVQEVVHEPEKVLL